MSRTSPAVARAHGDEKVGSKLTRFSFTALRNRNYRNFFVGTAISNIGTWVHRIGQDWLVLELTNSGKALGIVVSAQFLPGFFFSLFGGTLADKLDRRRALVAINLFGCAIALTLGILVINDMANVITVTVAAFLLGTCTAIDGPIRQSYYVILVGENILPNALALNSLNINIGRLIGPVLSGMLIERFDTGPSFIINSFSYLVVAATVFMIRPSEYQLPPTVNNLEKTPKIRDGIVHVYSSKELFLSIICVSFLAMWGQDMQITSAMMAKETFERGAASFGLLGTAVALGAIAGALVISRKTSLPTVRDVGIKSLLMAGAWFLASLAPNFTLFAGALFICGYCAMGVNISGNGTLRTYTSPQFYGRAWGIYIFMWQSLIALGAPVLGWINETYSPRIAVAFGATMALLMSLFILRKYSALHNDLVLKDSH
ncbi:MAG: MFS transporter [Actinobacteria bacterium]|nr:MFS transporter [Actinomycetota bacterium]